jgi:hypothetical protein
MVGQPGSTRQSGGKYGGSFDRPNLGNRDREIRRWEGTWNFQAHAGCCKAFSYETGLGDSVEATTDDDRVMNSELRFA